MTWLPLRDPKAKGANNKSSAINVTIEDPVVFVLAENENAMLDNPKTKACIMDYTVRLGAQHGCCVRR